MDRRHGEYHVNGLPYSGSHHLGEVDFIGDQLLFLALFPIDFLERLLLVQIERKVADSALAEDAIDILQLVLIENLGIIEDEDLTEVPVH